MRFGERMVTILTQTALWQSPPSPATDSFAICREPHETSRHAILNVVLPRLIDCCWRHARSGPHPSPRHDSRHGLFGKEMAPDDRQP